MQIELADHQVVNLLCAGDANQYLAFLPKDPEEGRDEEAVGIEDERDSENKWVLPTKFWESDKPFQMRLLTRPDKVLIADNNCEPRFSLQLSEHTNHVSSWFCVEQMSLADQDVFRI